MPYPATPDTTINVGDRVRSYDFPGNDACYIEGEVTHLQWHNGCNQYRIKVTARVWHGEREDNIERHTFVLAPVNGTDTTFGDVTCGVERINEGNPA